MLQFVGDSFSTGWGAKPVTGVFYYIVCGASYTRGEVFTIKDLVVFVVSTVWSFRGISCAAFVPFFIVVTGVGSLAGCHGRRSSFVFLRIVCRDLLLFGFDIRWVRRLNSLFLLHRVR